MAVLGKTGAGKSSALRHIVEHLLEKKKRVCIIDPKGDWWGLKGSADGKGAGFPVIAFGDFKEQKASDIPINAQSGKHVAELISTGNRPCIIGFRGWMTGHMIRFWIDFASTLFNANSGELYLVGDEFHNFAPKGKILDPEAGKCLHWSNRLMSEGRGYGLVCLIASQRPQKVHNDTLTCCETLVAMRVVHKADRDAVQDWIEGCGDMNKGREVLNSLAGMARGEAFVWSPEIGFGPQRLNFPMFETFDSFAPPQLQKKVNNSGWSAVDLAAVKEKLANVIEEARANDPAELRREIAKLKKEVQKNSSAGIQALEFKWMEVPVLSETDAALIKRGIVVCENFFDKLKSSDEEVRQIYRLLNNLSGKIAVTLDKFKALPQGSPSLGKRRSAPVKSVPSIHRPVPPVSSNGNSDVSGGLKRMMIALAQRPGLNKRQLGVRAGLSSSSGTFGTYLGRLRSNGWISGNGEFSLTDSGLVALGNYNPLPEGQALLDYWLQELGESGASRMLRTLTGAYPDAMTKEQLGEAAKISHTSGTFGTYLGKLRTLELIDGRGELRAALEFFE